MNSDPFSPGDTLTLLFLINLYFAHRQSRPQQLPRVKTGSKT